MTTKLKKITEFKLEQSIDHPQYHPGASIVGTKWEKSVIGVGDSLHEAIDDALETIAQEGEYELSGEILRLEETTEDFDAHRKCFDCMDDENDEEDHEDCELQVFACLYLRSEDLEFDIKTEPRAATAEELQEARDQYDDDIQIDDVPPPDVPYKVTRENYTDVAQGLHWFCAGYHAGQSSTLYEVMSRLEYKPGPLEKGPELGTEADDVFNYLERCNKTALPAPAVREAFRLLGDIKRVMREVMES